MCSPILFMYCFIKSVSKAGGENLKVVLYTDAVVPGNPFRPEQARKVEAFYWVITSLPDFILRRTATWNVISLIRSSIVGSIPGGVSRVSRELLNVFKPLFSGIILPCGNDHVTLSCTFGGFLADLLAHKEILCCTGGGTARRPC